MDYFSCYIELVELRSATAEHVIVALKRIFARHGIPAMVCSDNGTCYAAISFQLFATTYSFQHIISSPRFPQANDEAERRVQIAGNLLRKAADSYLALLAYRVTPTHTGYSPAQLLMGRQLKSTLPLTQSALQPSTLPSKRLLKKMPLLSNSRQQITTSFIVRVTFSRANGGKKYGCLIISLVPPLLRRTHTVRTHCEQTVAVSSAVTPVFCALYC